MNSHRIVKQLDATDAAYIAGLVDGEGIVAAPRMPKRRAELRLGLMFFLKRSVVGARQAREDLLWLTWNQTSPNRLEIERAPQRVALQPSWQSQQECAVTAVTHAALNGILE